MNNIIIDIRNSIWLTEPKTEEKSSHEDLRIIAKILK